MGNFSDAFKSGQLIKQDEIERSKKRGSAQTQKLHQAIQAARKWITDVLAPVVNEVTDDVAADGNIVMLDISNPSKIVYQVTVAMHGKRPVQLGFNIDENGAINLYTDGSQGNTLGNITTVNKAQLQDIFIRLLKTIGQT